MPINIDEFSFYRGDEFNGTEDPRFSDRKFILDELKKVPFKYQAAIMRKYSDVYSSHNCTNKARRDANTRLRRAVKNINGNSSLER